MTQQDVILDAPEAAPRRSPAARLAVWSLFTLCGTLATLVLLSNPRVTEGIGAAADAVRARFGMTEAAAAAPEPAEAAVQVTSPRAVAARAEAGNDRSARPAVRSMPQSRIPVRRAGVSAGD